METYKGIEAFKELIRGMSKEELLVRKQQFVERIQLIDRALSGEIIKGKPDKGPLK